MKLIDTKDAVGHILCHDLTRIVPGRFGYWLDLGLLLFAAYLVGCAIGSWLRDRFMARQARPS